MPLHLTKRPARLHGQLKFTCPVCDHEQKMEEVSLPTRGLVTNIDVNLKGLVLVKALVEPSGHSFRAEVTYSCPNCKIPTKQFVPVEAEGFGG